MPTGALPWPGDVVILPGKPAIKLRAFIYLAVDMDAGAELPWLTTALSSQLPWRLPTAAALHG